MKKLRCNDGDIAVVIHEEPGREADIGRFVWVYGPAQEHADLGMVWGVAAERVEPLQEAPEGRGIGRLVLMPDAWLLSVRCRLVRRQRPDRTDMLPKFNRENIERAMGWRRP